MSKPQNRNPLVPPFGVLRMNTSNVPQNGVQIKKTEVAIKKLAERSFDLRTSEL